MNGSVSAVKQNYPSSSAVFSDSHQKKISKLSHSTATNIFEKKISWYIYMLLDRIAKHKSITNEDAVAEIQKSIKNAINGKQIIDEFLENYYQCLYPVFRVIIQDAQKLFIKRKVKICDINKIASIKFAEKNAKSIRKRESFWNKYLHKKDTQTNCDDKEEFIYTNKHKSNNFVFKVRDRMMEKGENAINYGDYVVVSPTDFDSISFSPAPTLLLLYPRVIDYIMNVVQNLGNYCNRCENCQLELDCKSIDINHLGEFSIICEFKNKNMDCIQEFKNAIKRIQDISGGEIKGALDRNNFAVRIIANTLSMKDVTITCRQAIKRNNYIQLLATNYQIGYTLNVMNGDFFKENFYIGKIVEVIPSGEIHFQKTFLRNDNPEDIDDKISHAITFVIERYTKKIKLEDLNAISFLKGFLMWFVQSCRTSSKDFDVYSNMQKLGLFDERENDDTAHVGDISMSKLSYKIYTT